MGEGRPHRARLDAHVASHAFDFGRENCYYRLVGGDVTGCRLQQQQQQQQLVSFAVDSLMITTSAVARRKLAIILEFGCNHVPKA